MSVRIASVSAAALLTTTLIAARSDAAVVFANFNVDEGPFNTAPNFSGTSTNTASTSTADRSTATAFEGAGSELLSIVPTAVGSTQRVRLLAGSGNPTSPLNTPFTVPASGAPMIGYFLKTAAAGLTTQLVLDRPSNVAADYEATVAKNVIADNAWHLYEWNLRDSTQFTAAPGIGGGTTAPAAGESLTVDSIYLTNAAGVSYTANIDFVAFNEAGTIYAIAPEPAALAALGLVGITLVRRRRA